MDEVKKKRGRPPKKEKEVVSENNERLEMENKSNFVTIDDVNKSLTNLFNASLNSAQSFTLDYGRFNPFLQNSRLKLLNQTPPSQMDKEDLIKALGSPQNSEQALRGQGWSLSSTQYLYYKILRFACDVPKYNYYKIPEKLTKEEEYKSKKFVNEDKFVDEWLETFDIKNTFKRVSLDVKREGKSTYVLRNCINYEDGVKKPIYATWQKMPSNYIKLIGIGERGYIASFNMLIFMNPAVSLSFYPDFIQKIWFDLVEKRVITENSIGGVGSLSKYTVDCNKIVNYSYDYNGERITGILEATSKSSERAYMFWVPLPQDYCYTFCSDTSNPWVLPDTAGLFLGLQELTDYDQLAGLLQSTPLTGVLTGEIEPIPNPSPGQDQTIMNPSTIVGFQNKFNESTSSNIEAFFAPLKNFKIHSLPNIPNSNETTTNATRNFIYRSGLGGMITTTEKPSVTQIKTAQKLQEAECEFVTLQFESVINMIVNKLIGCEFKWKIQIWGGIFSFDDDMDRAKEIFVAGGTFALPKLASGLNLNMRDVKAINSYIDSLDIYKGFKTITQEKQIELSEMNRTQSTNSVGRPNKNDNEIDNDNTEQSIDGGLNTSDTRKYETKINKFCKICGVKSYNTICEGCFENILEEYNE